MLYRVLNGYGDKQINDVEYVVKTLRKGLRLGDTVVIVRGSYNKSVEIYEDGRFKVSLSDGVMNIIVSGRVSEKVVIESIYVSTGG